MFLIRRILAVVVCFGFMMMVAFVPAARGEDFSFTASVDRVRLGVDEELELTVSVSGTGIRNVGEPEIPNLSDFEVLGRSTSQSSQFSIVNGRMTSRKTIDYLYVLRPAKTGALVIPSARVQFKGRNYMTEPIRVEVTKGSVPGQRVPDQPAVNLSEGEVLLDGRVDKTAAYVGEQVTIDYSLFTSAGLSNVRLGNIPSYSGFWSEEIFSARRLDFKSRVFKGKRYEVAPIKSVALFPTTTGEFEIEPMSITCEVVTRGRDPFRDFWSRTRAITVKNSPISIKVKALPDDGRPIDFSGAVGSFKFDLEASTESISVGEPLEIVVKVTGEGNIRTLEVPEFPDMPEFKTYEPEVRIDVSKSEGRISGSKSYKYMAVPGSQGKYVIPAQRFSFFDPRGEKYHILTTNELSILVTPGVERELMGGTARGPVQVLGRDILYIKPNLGRLNPGGAYLHQNRLFLLAQVFPAALLLFTLLLERRRRRIGADAAYVRARRARHAARARLRDTEPHLDSHGPIRVASEVASILTSYVGDRMNMNTAGLTLEKILDALRSRGVAEPVLEGLEACMERCDFLRFAVSETDGEVARDIVELARQTIDALEGQDLR
jgi:hypothetical protein